MRRLLLLAAIAGLLVWRKRQLDDCDRQHGYGPYADLRPAVKESDGG